MRTFLALLSMLLCMNTVHGEDSSIYELQCFRTQAGFADQFCNLVKTDGLRAINKQSVELLGAWRPVNSSDERLFLLFKHSSKEEALRVWTEVREDEEWLAASQKATPPQGDLIQDFQRIFLNTMDYSPSLSLENNSPRVFELRTYVATPGNLKNLNDRFRNHTVELFAKHGITNLIYWSVERTDTIDCDDLFHAVGATKAEALKESGNLLARDNALVYLLGHPSEEAGKASFQSFLADPVWKKALDESVKNAGGSLTVPGGVQSVYLKATDFSPVQ